METTLISKCCKEEVVKHVAGDEVGYECCGCNEQCEVEEACANCLGTGKETVMERVYANEPHMAPMTRPCSACTGKKKDDEHES